MVTEEVEKVEAETAAVGSGVAATVVAVETAAEVTVAVKAVAGLAAV